VRVAVTGASGNIGTSLLAELGSSPDIHEVVGVARRRPEAAFPKVRWVAADVASSDLRPAFEGADAVVHLAWAIQPSRDQGLLRRINVDGSRRVFAAAADAGAKTIVYASSVGTYAPVPVEAGEDRVRETHPATGIESSLYSVHKAEVEAILDAFEPAHPDVAVARIRPGLVFKREAASEIRRYFAGPLFPNALLRTKVPVVPLPEGIRVQCVHADDAARAFALALAQRARGAFNVAAEPQLAPVDLASALGGRPLELPARLFRALAGLTWRGRVQPTPEGWLDLGMGVPAMSTERVRAELGWSERVRADEALRELIQGLGAGAGGETPPLHRRAGGRFRSRELRTGIGARP
jgi:UDP-glucose 4-epimerase